MNIKDLQYIFVFVWVAIMEYHKLSGLTNRNSFLTVLESGKLEIRGPAGSGSSARPLLGVQMVVLLCPHMAEKERKQAVSLVSLPVMAPIPSGGSTLVDLITSQRLYLQISHHTGN